MPTNALQNIEFINTPQPWGMLRVSTWESSTGVKDSVSVYHPLCSSEPTVLQ